jgi:hypothetical protein
MIIGQINSMMYYLLCRLYKAVTSYQPEVQDCLTPSSTKVPKGKVIMIRIANFNDVSTLRSETH